MTSYLLYPENALIHVVPDHVDPKHACFVEPFSCSLHAVDLGKSIDLWHLELLLFHICIYVKVILGGMMLLLSLAVGPWAWGWLQEQGYNK